MLTTEPWFIVNIAKEREIANVPLVVQSKARTSALPFSKIALVLLAGKQESKEVSINAVNAKTLIYALLVTTHAYMLITILLNSNAKAANPFSTMRNANPD